MCASREPGRAPETLPQAVRHGPLPLSINTIAQKSHLCTALLWGKLAVRAIDVLLCEELGALTMQCQRLLQEWLATMWELSAGMSKVSS